jgi:PAS domain S-box-containing protein
VFSNQLKSGFSLYLVIARQQFVKPEKQRHECQECLRRKTGLASSALFRFKVAWCRQTNPTIYEVMKTTMFLKELQPDDGSAFRLLFENHLDAILLTDQNGKIYAANPIACKMFQGSEQEICCRGLKGLLPLYEEKPINTSLQASEGRAGEEIVCLRKDGTCFRATMHGFPFWSTSEPVLCVLTIRVQPGLLKIMDTKDPLQGLYEEVFSMAPSCIGVVTGENYEVVMMNASFHRLFGEAAAIGKVIAEAATKPFQQSLSHLFHTVWATGQPVERQEFAIHLRDGSNPENKTLFLDFMCVPQKNDGGDVEALFFFANDRTEQVLLRQNNAELENKCQNFFENSPLPKFLVEADTLNFHEVNHAACSLYGYSHEEFKNMTLPQLFFNGKEASEFGWLLTVEKSTGPGKQLVNHVKKSGEVITVEMHAADCLTSGVKTYLVIVSDLTEQLSLQRNLSQARLAAMKRVSRAQIKGQEEERAWLTAELHDNINQRLCAANLYLNEYTTRTQDSDMRFVVQSRQILQSVITDIRGICRMLITPTLKDIGLIGSMNELVNVFNASGQFHTTLEAPAFLDEIDDELKHTLYRIVEEQLTNIASDAIATEVAISFVLLENELQLMIKNDGVAVSPEKQKPGLGLRNIQNRIDLFNGHLTVEALPENGCRLFVSIPVFVQKEQKSKTPRKIFVAEDDLLDQELIETAFQDVDRLVHLNFANNGRELIEALEKLPDDQLPSLIIIDYNMPYLNGYNTIKALEADERLRNIPKVVYSTSYYKVYEEQCLSSNAKAYIKKGSTLDEIKENVKQMMSYCRVSEPFSSKGVIYGKRQELL